jgi:hypothetical protein
MTALHHGAVHGGAEVLQALIEGESHMFFKYRTYHVSCLGNLKQSKLVKL